MRKYLNNVSAVKHLKPVSPFWGFSFVRVMDLTHQMYFKFMLTSLLWGCLDLFSPPPYLMKMVLTDFLCESQMAWGWSCGYLYKKTFAWLPN